MIKINREIYQTRSLMSNLKTRAEPDNSEMVIEGYFVVFNTKTELWTNAFEIIAPTAFDKCLSNDVRALINHDTTLVLGRNKSGTLKLSKDDRGLWGSITINPKDADAVNLYERVKRGDVDQCSFGFDIKAEDTVWGDNGSVTWTITEVDLYEVSVCTFPAYEDTGVQARKKSFEQEQKRMAQTRKQELKKRLEGIKC